MEFTVSYEPPFAEVLLWFILTKKINSSYSGGARIVYSGVLRGKLSSHSNKSVQQWQKTLSRGIIPNLIKLVFPLYLWWFIIKQKQTLARVKHLDV